jgi:hypothetical protein
LQERALAGVEPALRDPISAPKKQYVGTIAEPPPI